MVDLEKKISGPKEVLGVIILQLLSKGMLLRWVKKASKNVFMSDKIREGRLGHLWREVGDLSVEMCLGFWKRCFRMGDSS